MNVIETWGLSKVYSSWWRSRVVKALDGLDLSVQENCVYGFLGPNGAGKTTTIKLLLGLINPTRGKGSLLGAPLGDLTAKQSVGFLPDSPNFYPHLTATGFLTYCAKLLHMEWSGYTARINQLLEQMGLYDVRNRRLAEFSRGMLQRVGIAQALLNDPKLVILDEPITGLDPLGRAEIKKIIRTLQATGKTVFFSSHILADVEQMCDYVGILNCGRLIKKGAVNDLLTETEIVLWSRGLAAPDVEKLEPQSESVIKKKELWGFCVNDSRTADKLKAQIVEKGAQIVTIDGKRTCLEDFFLETVERDNISRQKQTDKE